MSKTTYILGAITLLSIAGLSLMNTSAQSTEESTTMYGGFTKQDLSQNDETQQAMIALAKETIQSSNDTQDYQITKVLGLYTQVVAGIKYRVDLALLTPQGENKIATVDILNRPWLVQGADQTQVLNVEVKDGAKKQLREQPQNKEESVAYGLDFAVKYLTEETNEVNSSMYTLNKSESKLIKEQIVAGVAYTYNIVFNGQDNSSKTYEVKVWMKPWENFVKVTDVQEKNVPELKESMAGGWSQVEDQNNLFFEKARDRVIERKTTESNGDYTYVSMQSAQQQIVAGVKYRFVMTFRDNQAKEDQQWEFIVLSQPWMNTLEVLSEKPVDNE